MDGWMDVMFLGGVGWGGGGGGEGRKVGGKREERRGER